MGMIKLPEESINYFKKNLDEIFTSGNLAEGKRNNDICTWAKNYTSAEYALPVSSNGAGLFAILSILRRYRNYKRVFWKW